MSFISQKTIDEIKNRAGIVALVSEYVRLEQRGATYWGLCPFHTEKTPSFSVNPDRNSYHCFGCNEGGGVINFIMSMEKISFPEALLLLAKKFSVPVEYENSRLPLREDEEAARAKDDLAELYRRVAASFHHILMNSDEGRQAKSYVIERGISLDMIERFNLGWSPADRFWLHNFLVKKGYSPEFLLKSALFSRKYPKISFFSARLMFPINNRNGGTVAFGGRILPGEANAAGYAGDAGYSGGAEDGPKYLNSAESALYRKRETLFALDFALPELRRTKTVYICEGYMDVIALHEAGITNAVAPLGTAFTEEQARLLRRWVDSINLLFDNDSAGMAACEKTILICRALALPCSVVIPKSDCTTFKDPADILRYAGKDALVNAARQTVSDADYLIEKAKTLLNAAGGGVVRAINALVPFFNSIESAVEREVFSRRAAFAFGADPKAVYSDLSLGGAKASAAPKAARHVEKRAIIKMNEELFLLCAAAVNFETQSGFFSEIRNNIPIEEFYDGTARELYLAMEECVRAGENGLDTLLARLDDEVLRDFVAEKCAVREFSDNAERLIADGIRGVKIRNLERAARAIDANLRLAANEGRPRDELLLEKQFILDDLARYRNCV